MGVNSVRLDSREVHVSQGWEMWFLRGRLWRLWGGVWGHGTKWHMF